MTDFNMPVMDGLALVKEAKRLNPHLPVVMASGFLSDKLCEQALLLGVTLLVQKERTVEDLVPAVREAIARCATGPWPAHDQTAGDLHYFVALSLLEK